MAFKRLAAAATLLAASAKAISIDVNSPDTLKQAGFLASHGMMSYYSGNQSGQTPGYLPNEGAVDGYYWWEGSGVFGSLIDYWYYSGDATYNDVVTQAMTWQAGPNQDYEPANASQTLGNDDIGFWALSALKAGELTFPNPPKDQPQWIPIVQNVFSNYVKRWDTATCGGGLRWQVFLASPGYHYKNTVANGCFFNIGARLGKYSGNSTFTDWAEKVYDWTKELGLITAQNIVMDGTDANQNCSTINNTPWTYNQALYLYGAATMYNITQSQKWRTETQNLLTAMVTTFFRSGILTEIGCQDTHTCDNNEKSFRSYSMIWLAETAKVASFTAATIEPLLASSAQGAARQCNGGSDGVTCGLDWSSSTWDGSKGIGEQMSALEAFNSVLAPYKAGPIKSYKDGGTSAIDPTAGGTSTSEDAQGFAPITTADKAGAGIITFLLFVATILGSLWMAFDDPIPFLKGFNRVPAFKSLG